MLIGIGGVSSNPGSCIVIFISSGLAYMDNQTYYVLQMRTTTVNTSVSILGPCSAASCAVGITSQLES